jgi:hypothetical protein
MSDDRHHRRDFVRTLALGASAATLSGPAVRGDEPKHDKEEPPKPRSEADARMELILARFGKHLDADARKSIRGEVESIVRRAEALRKFPLDNGDGPLPVFSPYRAPLGEEDSPQRHKDTE